MHSRQNGREEAIHSGKEDKRNCSLGPVGHGGGSIKGKDQATHTCPGALPPAVPALQQHREGTRKAEGGQRTLDPPQVPEYPEHVTLQCHGRPSVPWAVAQSQSWAKLLWTLILDVWNAKEIWININPLSKFKVSTPAHSDGKENLSAERLALLSDDMYGGQRSESRDNFRK